MASKLGVNQILAEAFDDSNDALKVAHVNPENEWSTTETDTGRKDANGLAIYRKVLSGLLANSGNADLTHSITDLNVAEGAHLVVQGTVSDGTTVEPLALAANVTVVSVDATKVRITSDADLSSKTAFVLLEYTRTT